MEIRLRSALIDHLAGHPKLAGELNSISEEVPLRASLPWLAIVASASTDWSNKTHHGREVRVAIELQTRGDDPETASTLVREIEDAVSSMPAVQADFRIVNVQFLRARTEQRGGTTRAVLLEYRFRLLAN